MKKVNLFQDKTKNVRTQPFIQKTITYDNGTEMAKHELITKNRYKNILCPPPILLNKEEQMKTQMNSIRRFLPKRNLTLIQLIKTNSFVFKKTKQ